MNHDYWLQSLTLNNYRCFDRLEVALDRHLTVLVADNGVGKTSVLDAASVALSAFVGAFHNGRRFGISRGDVRLALMPGDILQMEPQYSCVLEGAGLFYGQPVEWQRRMNTPKSSNTYKEANELIAIGKRLQQQVSDEDQSVAAMLPVMAYYGTGRLWSEKKVTEKKSYEAEFYTRTAGYLDCLDPSSSYKYFVEWFRFTAKAHRDLRDQNEQRYGQSGLAMPTPYAALLEGVSLAVDTCLKHTGWHGLRYSSIHNAPVVEHPQQGVLEVSQLSDGLRNMVALVADLAYRSTRLNPHLKAEAAQQTPGIVLIDEIDMHLHPAWQQQVLQQLRAAFPLFQFIVTTHSPQVLSTIHREQIRVLGKNAEGDFVAAQPVAQSYGRSNADVLQAVMHIEPIPPVDESVLLDEYLQWVEQGDLSDPVGAEMETKLKATLGDDHPELVRLAMVKRRRERLG
ncbi:MAG: AAA family ATPase [Gammaproteobacteria bacterium]|jgi:predicted ATP-binding protein involved in virulence|nr:AAA family ATPase [Gammaproteobacteria bacterium]